MTFGPSYTLAYFQGFINKILAEKLDMFVILYLNDILIYTKNPSQNPVNLVHWVLE